MRPFVSERRTRILDLGNGLAESGLESIVRLLAVDLGLSVAIQVRFPRLARADLLIEGWVIVETDGDEFHDEKVTTKDRRRDAALVARGYTVLRFRYAQVVYELESVARAIAAAVGGHRRIRNAGKLAARARGRIATTSFS